MTFLEEKVLIETTFKNEWTETPVVFENVVAPMAKEWVRLTIQPAAGKQMTLGDNPEFQHTSVMFIQVFVPIGAGSGRALQLVDIIDGLFRNRQLEGLQFLVPQVTKTTRTSSGLGSSTPVSSTGYYLVTVSVTFFRRS